jgi:hypothetical protein
LLRCASAEHQAGERQYNQSTFVFLHGCPLTDTDRELRFSRRLFVDAARVREN